MTPTNCPICNSHLSLSHSLELECKDISNQYHYRYLQKELVDYSYFTLNAIRYRIYNNFLTNKSIIRAYYNKESDSQGKIILRFDFNIPINPNSLNRFLNLKAFL